VAIALSLVRLKPSGRPGRSMGVAMAMGSRERLPRQKASCCGAVTMHLALNWYRLTQALHQRDPDAAEQRIGTDEVHADGRGPSPLNSVLSPAATPQLQRSQPREQGCDVSPAGFPSIVTYGRRLTQLHRSLFHPHGDFPYRFVVSRLTCPSQPRITFTSTPAWRRWTAAVCRNTMRRDPTLTVSAGRP